MFPNTRDEKFKGEDARGKTFLFVDKMTGDKQAICCVEPVTDTKEYATLNTFYMPLNSSIITEEDKADATHDEMLARFEEVSFNACQAVQEHITKEGNYIKDFIVQQMDKLKEEGINGGSGISEKTLLNALEIVTKNK